MFKRMFNKNNKTEVEPLNGKISPASSFVGLTQGAGHGSNDLDNAEFEAAIEKSGVSERFSLMNRVDELMRSAFQEQKYRFENGTPKEFLKTVSFSVHLSGKQD